MRLGLRVDTRVSLGYNLNTPEMKQGDMVFLNKSTKSAEGSADLPFGLQLLIRRWNERLSRDILAHWLDLLSEEGWIAREQVCH